jgi:hypothetical protein
MVIKVEVMVHEDGKDWKKSRSYVAYGTECEDD